MGTICYFEGTLKDKGDGREIFLEVGKTSYDENGPVDYLNIDGKSICLDHDTAKKLCDGFAGVASYMGYDK